ncbi:Major Facilitator superfamily [Seminavis robusta]|uniref:Major Facilitator superfamily n=1 Tax=Seminavis robusta TaxID=568900 RepID=A0A9N8F0S7_9STRA|nr:Major Facilitator superfamily [Seminavis robusta]|eukprot:Sro2188_g318230.1 Major Facilitator superfamily (256) ;mRNA; r:13797-14564
MMMTGVFNVLNLCFLLFIQFPNSTSNSTSEQQETQKQPSVWPEIWSIIKTRTFLTPMASMTLAWIIMSAPMTLLRVAMHEVGFSDRQSLVGIELHFIGMYAPGFFVGALIQQFGPRCMTASSILLFAAGIATLQTAQGNDESGDMPEAVWFVGMILMGAAWNVGFNGGTVWLTQSYREAPQLKSSIQSANDLHRGLCRQYFLLVPYEAGGSQLQGWQAVHWIALELLGVFVVLLLVDAILVQRQRKVSAVTATNE